MTAKSVHICLFEDQGAARFSPLVYFRPVYNLRCGISSLKEKVLLHFPRSGFTLQCRDYLAGYMRHRNPGVLVNDIPGSRCLFINGRVVMDRKLRASLDTSQTGDVAFTCGDFVVAAWVSGPALTKLKQHIGRLLTMDDFSGIPREEIEADLVSYPWDLIHRNADQLIADYAGLVGKKKSPVSVASLKRRGVQVFGGDEVYVSADVSIKPGTLLDAENGPIYVGRGVQILAHANIMGPASIGDRSWVKVGAQIYPNTTIGPVCKIGGEVEGSIFHGYSNKQHHGFIGHSYIGAWVNLGAGTTNSDLKSNYGLVRVQTADGIVDTGQQFIGLMMGDHSKTAINSMFNTGTIVGIASNIFGFGFPPKYVPSFSWGAAGETFTTFNIDQAIEMARRVMARRSILLLEEEEQLFRTIFAITAEERRLRGMPH